MKIFVVVFSKYIFFNFETSYIFDTKMTFKKLCVDQIDLKDKRVFLRLDLNVPTNAKGQITSDKRVRAAIPTINYILQQGAKSIVICSHRGNPEDNPKVMYSMIPIVGMLETILGRGIHFLTSCYGLGIEVACFDPKPGSIFVLENVRYHCAEFGFYLDKDRHKSVLLREQMEAFQEGLRKLADIYVNDAFGTAHRDHSSMLGKGFEIRAAGLLMKKELEYFSKIMDNPKRPLLAIMGGAKVDDKIDMIDNLLDKVDELIIGGGMAFTFLNAIKGMKIGNSLYSSTGSKIVKYIMEKANKNKVKIHFPTDFLISQSKEKSKEIKSVKVEDGIPDGWIGVDIGPETIAQFKEPIFRAKTIFWNGPMGIFEVDEYEAGTKSLLNYLTEATKQDIITVVGGGDTSSAVEKYEAEDKLSHVSTGGGAALALLEGRKLPGVEALCDAKSL